MYCNKCGKEIGINDKFCNYCGANTNNERYTINYNNTTIKEKKKVYQQWWFWLIIVLAIIVALFFSTVISSTEVSIDPNFTNEYLANKEQEQLAKEKQEKEEKAKKEQDEKKRQEQEEKQKQENIKKQKEDYKKSCKKYTYKDIARNPEKYEGKQVKFTGEVIQVLEGYFNTVTFRINVTKSEYGFWEDTIYCTYTYSKDESKILEDDIVTIYGECKGTTSYTSIFGQTITVPEVKIKYIELVK